MSLVSLFLIPETRGLDLNSSEAVLVHKNFHHEPFDETAAAWRVTGEGRLQRQTRRSHGLFFGAIARCSNPDIRGWPSWKRAHTALRYVLSGGLSWRSPLPGFFYPWIRWIDEKLARYARTFPLFQTIILERR